MPKISRNIQSAKGLRNGTATISKGKARSDEILRTAQHILVHEGYERFTLRNIATNVGIRLGNLQYYYKTKADLLREMLQYANEISDLEYGEMFSKVSDNPKDRFRTIVNYLLDDLKQPEVRGLFLQSWALATHDDYAEHCMEETSTNYRDVLAVVIAELTPGLSKRELNNRATLIHSMIEGSHFSLSLKRGRLVQRPGLDDLIKDRVYNIATRPGSNKSKVK